MDCETSLLKRVSESTGSIIREHIKVVSATLAIDYPNSSQINGGSVLSDQRRSLLSPLPGQTTLSSINDEKENVALEGGAGGSIAGSIGAAPALPEVASAACMLAVDALPL